MWQQQTTATHTHTKSQKPRSSEPILELTASASPTKQPKKGREPTATFECPEKQARCAKTQWSSSERQAFLKYPDEAQY